METNIYDKIVIEFQKENKSVGSISIDKKDLDTLINLHEQTMPAIIADMAKELENGIRERASK